MTDPIIFPTADGWVLRCGKQPIGPFRSFREAQLELQKLYGRQEFARRFPVTAQTISAETIDRPRQGGPCSAQEAA